MNFLDRWYNRNFPVHSPQRLGFLLAATVPIGLVVAVGRDLLGMSAFSWDTYIGITICMWVVVALGWYLAREGYGPDADTDEDEGSLSITRHPLPPGIPPPPPAPPSGPGEGWSYVDPDDPPQRRETSLAEVAVSAAMLFVAIRTAGWALLPDDFWSPVRILIDLAGAVLVTALVATSFSLFMLLLVAGLISFPAAALLHLFFFFLSGDESIWGYWIFTFAVACMFAISFWFQIRSLKRSRRWVDLPLWATSLGASVMMAVLSLTAATGSPEPVFERPAATSSSGTDLAAAGSPRGAGTQEEAARLLLQAWASGDRVLAGVVAYPSVVDSLFAAPVPAETTFGGCGKTASGWSRCALTSPTSVRLLGFHTTSGGGYFVRFVELAPPGTELQGAVTESPAP